MKTYLRLLTYVKPYFWQVVLHALFAILAVVAMGVALSLLDPVLNLLFSENAPGELAERGDFSLNFNERFHYELLERIREKGKPAALMFAVMVIVGINLFGNLFRYLGNFFMAIIRTRVVEDIRSHLFKKINRLQIGYFEGERKGDIMTRMTSDVNEIEKSVVVTFQSLFRDPFTIIFFIVLMLNYSWELTLFIFAILPISAIVISFISKSLRRAAYNTQDMLSWLMSIIDEFTSGIRVIKAFNARGYITGVFNRYNERYSFYTRKQFHRQQLVPPISESLGVITLGFILWFGGKLVFAGDLNASGFLVFIFYFQQIMKPAKNVSSAFSNIYRGIASGERLFHLMDARVTIADKKNAKTIEQFTDGLEFRNVSFAYHREPVLKDINLKVPKGKIYALVGPSGSGKSTLAELALRFYDPTEGGIYIDGINLTDLKLSHLREQIGLVTQDPILFNDTLYNNIAFGMQDVDEDDVVNAAKAANAHDFILEADDGYQTMIGDRGVLLSGGQRQRLSIARAVLKNPPIMVLDEATSALDTSSERIVQEALYELMKNRTSIVIAHRLSTIQQADKIIVLDRGKIAQQGTHMELVEQEGLYNKLHKMQQLAD